MTDQEKRLYWNVYAAVEDEVNRQGGCFCRGYAMAIEKSIQSLVATALDTKVHGATIREDPHDPS